MVLLVVLRRGRLRRPRAGSTRVRPVEVEVATVSERAAGTQAAVLNASGYVTARRRATVSSKITGKVVEVNVEEGMAIKEGQVLARLDDATSKAALALAEAQAEAARRASRENEVRLAEAKLALGRDDAAREGATDDRGRGRQGAGGSGFPRCADRRRARAGPRRERQIELEQTNLDNTIIRAPFSGIAISKDAQPGEMVSPVSAGGGFTRTGICTIVDMRSLEIEVDVNESYINRVESRSERDGGAERVPRVGDSRRTSSRRYRRPTAEGDRAGAHRIRGARSRGSCRTWA